MQGIQETLVWSLGQKVPLEKERTTHSSILAWKISQVEESGGLPSTVHGAAKSWTRLSMHMPLGEVKGVGRGQQRKDLQYSKRVDTVKNLPVMQETRVQSLGWEDPLEKGMAIHSSILAWRIPWREKPGRLQFMGSQRVRHGWVINTHTHKSGQNTGGKSLGEIQKFLLYQWVRSSHRCLRR